MLPAGLHREADAAGTVELLTTEAGDCAVEVVLGCLNTSEQVAHIRPYLLCDASTVTRLHSLPPSGLQTKPFVVPPSQTLEVRALREHGLKDAWTAGRPAPTAQIGASAREALELAVDAATWHPALNPHAALQLAAANAR